MKRDMMKIVAETKGKVPRAYNMTCVELMRLMEISVGGGDTNAAFEAITMAFDYGFALGVRSEKNKKKSPSTKTGAKA